MKRMKFRPPLKKKVLKFPSKQQQEKVSIDSDLKGRMVFEQNPLGKTKFARRSKQRVALD